MSSNIKSICIAVALLVSVIAPSYSQTIDRILKEAVIDNGFLPLELINPPTEKELSALGQIFFESKNLSNQDIACVDCHLDQFSSADGLPNAIGIGGIGEGFQRINNRGEVIPRNTLTLWGRGANQITTLFWDGRVQNVNENIISQFGENPPSHQLLDVAVHLPVLEIREMLIEDELISELKSETVNNAQLAYEYLLSNLRKNEPEALNRLAQILEKDIEYLKFQDVARAISEFITDKFQLRPTKFYNYIYGQQQLSENEKKGAEIFYGIGKCAVCHSGSQFSDESFHSIPTPQLGYGKNGFGIDYGRYNVTHNPSDLYKFRTPSLINISESSPYSHSGSVSDLDDMIRYHFDPLYFGDEIAELRQFDRVEFYKKILAGRDSLMLVPQLNDVQISQLVSFLNTLTFED